MYESKPVGAGAEFSNEIIEQLNKLHDLGSPPEELLKQVAGSSLDFKLPFGI
jgi:hypothetical protein